MTKAAVGETRTVLDILRTSPYCDKVNRIQSTSVLGCLVATIIVATSCTSAAAPIVPDNVSMTVDSAAYHLQPTRNGYEVNLTVTVVNSSSRDIYLGQFCGFWGISRADGSRTSLGEYECALATSGLDRLVIQAGQRYAKTFNLPASIQPQARPQITLEDNLGAMVFRYQFVDAGGRKSEPFSSMPFQVLPPA